jgi:protein-S-isoprenylcysteine O-methyltransferase Ste14
MIIKIVKPYSIWKEIDHMKKELQQIIGYIVGGSLVLLIIPYGIYSAAKYFDPILGIELLQIEQLKITLACVLFLIGFIFGIWSILIQNTIGKGGPLQVANIEISPKTQNLIISGPYKYTRNPMLFGACLMYFALAVYLNSMIAVIIVLLFMICMLVFVKLSEEKRLLKDFGKSYEGYRGKVPMFIPWIPKK